MDELIPVIPQVDLDHRTLRHQRPNNVSNREISQKNVSFEPAPGKKIDPDVKRMMETSSNNFNVTSIPHKQTEEEKEILSSKCEVAGTSSWVIIVMAVVVVLLICAIVYLVLKYNETCEVPPTNILDSLKRKRGEVVRIPTQLQSNGIPSHTISHTQAPNHTSVKLSNQTSNSNPDQTKTRGTKDEVLKMLKSGKINGQESKLSTVLENTENTSEQEISPPKITEQEKPTESDSAMINDFYHQMDMNASNEEIPEEAVE